MIRRLLTWLDRRIDARIGVAAQNREDQRRQAWWDGLSAYEKGVQFGQAVSMRNGASDGGALYDEIDHLSKGRGR